MWAIIMIDVETSVSHYNRMFYGIREVNCMLFNGQPERYVVAKLNAKTAHKER